jgi:signal transduction histidine kinase
VFPLSVWAALRLGQRGVATANLVVMVVAVWATVHGQGPFMRATLNESLLLLQTFMSVLVVTTLLLGASVAERNRAIAGREEFISIASHELKTPLTPLKLNLQLLRRVSGGPAPLATDGGARRDVDKLAATAERQVERLEKLVADLLDVARSRSGRLTIHREPLDLAALVRETVDGFGEQAAQHRCLLQVHASEPLLGQWDRLRMQQVVSNLVTNAMKFCQGKPVEISAHAVGGSAVLVVHDRGLGIDRKEQKRLFRPFERAASSRHYPGLGLGLYIVSQIVEAHGGAIRVESQLGAGATFTVTLPL